MKNWKWVPILLTFEKVEMGATLNNIKAVSLNAMGGYGGFTNEPWPPSGFALDAMVILCSRAFELRWLHKHKNKLPLLSSMSIM
jgi:hypothetical protein